MAEVTAGLAHWHPAVGAAVADLVLEELRVGLEMAHAAHSQARVAVAHFVGELARVGVIDSTTVVNTLHLLLTHPVRGMGAPGFIPASRDK